MILADPNLSGRISPIEKYSQMPFVDSNSFSAILALAVGIEPLLIVRGHLHY
jgi:hypothetical protein